MHAVVTTPAESAGASFARFPIDISFPPVARTGQLPHYTFRGLLDVYSRYGLHIRRTPKGPSTPEASVASLPLRLLRLLPAGATVAGWDSHPLKDRAFARRTEHGVIRWQSIGKPASSSLRLIALCSATQQYRSTSECDRLRGTVLRLGNNQSLSTVRACLASIEKVAERSELNRSEILLRILREEHFKTHQSPSFWARSRFTTSATGFTLPCSICLLPRARIFRSAIVSWVSS